MNGTIKFAVPLLAALAIAGCNAGGSSTMPGSSGQSVVSQAHSVVPDMVAKGLASPACPQIVGKPTCLALIDKNSQKQGAGPAVPGWAPIDLQTRYNAPITKGTGQIVAIVDAYDNPNVASDLAQYRTNFGLGTANFKKYNQTGQQSNYPSGSTGWGVEIDLDVQMVSAMCPLCTIYLIEANGADSNDLQTAEAEAVTLGAHIISNSWICYGSVSCVSSSYFDTPGVEYLAASGDAGYNNNGAPEALASVVAVGGTVLSKSGSTYSETTWSSAGSGCATGVTKPSWQHDTGCSYRTDADVSAVAQSVAEYDTYGESGWFTVSGTSVASPINAAVFGLAGNASSRNAAQQMYQLSKKKKKHAFHDITTGADGSCGGSYLCTAMKGYDGPTGWGTPNGIGAY